MLQAYTFKYIVPNTLIYPSHTDFSYSGKYCTTKGSNNWTYFYRTTVGNIIAPQKHSRIKLTVVASDRFLGSILSQLHN